MDNSRFLINYNYLTINHEDFELLGLDDLSKVNHNLNDLITSFGLVFVRSIGDAYVKGKSINFDLDKLKIDLCSLFNLVPSENTPVKLRKILKRINTKRANALVDYPYFRILFPELKSFDREVNKNYIKLYFNSYFPEIQKSIKLLIDFLENENKYSKVTFDGIKENNLSLYLAYQVMDKALKFQENEDIVGFNKAINYLENFLNNNPLLVERDFIFNGNEEIYSVKKIESFLSSIKNGKTTLNNNEEKDEYEEPVILTRNKNNKKEQR